VCLFSQTINGEVIDLNKKAGSADFVQGGCGAACKNNHCKLGGKCLDNYNVYKCDCSLTPFYGYFCHKGMMFCCFSGLQHLIVDYRIYSDQHRGAYLIFHVSGAALIRGRCSFKMLIPQRQNYTYFMSIFHGLQAFI